MTDPDDRKTVNRLEESDPSGGSDLDRPLPDDGSAADGSGGAGHAADESAGSGRGEDESPDDGSAGELLRRLEGADGAAEVQEAVAAARDFLERQPDQDVFLALAGLLDREDRRGEALQVLRWGWEVLTALRRPAGRIEERAVKLDPGVEIGRWRPAWGVARGDGRRAAPELVPAERPGDEEAGGAAGRDPAPGRARDEGPGPDEGPGAEGRDPQAREAGAAPEPGVRARRRDSAPDAARREELRRGLEVLEELVRLAPEDPALRLRKVAYARALEDDSLLEEALLELGAVLERTGDDVDGGAGTGQTGRGGDPHGRGRRSGEPPPDALGEEAELRKALEVLDGLLEERPGDLRLRERKVRYARRTADPGLLADAYVGLAGGLAEEGSRRGARLLYRAALELDPGGSRARQGLARLDTAELEEKRSTGKRAGALHSTPREPRREEKKARRDLGMRLWTEFENAIREMPWLQAATQAYQATGPDAPPPLEAFELLGRYLLFRGRHRDAASVLSRALDLADRRDEELTDLLFHLGTAHRRLGEEEEAEACFRRLARVDPDFARVREELAEDADPDGGGPAGYGGRGDVDRETQP